MTTPQEHHRDGAAPPGPDPDARAPAEPDADAPRRVFRDRYGASWTVDLTVAAMKRVRILAGVDLYRAAEKDSGVLADLYTDPIVLVDVLYAVCKPEADERGLDDEAFGALFSGDSIEQACSALLGGLVDFTRNPRDRRVLGAQIAETDRGMEMIRDHNQALIESGEMTRAVTERVRLETSGASGSSTSSPGSSGSTPGP